MVAPLINNTRNLGDWEYQKFREDDAGKPSVSVVNADGTAIGDKLPTSGNNPSYTLDTITVGLVHTLTLTKTIGSTIYTKTTVIDTSDNSITESAWV